MAALQPVVHIISLPARLALMFSGHAPTLKVIFTFTASMDFFHSPCS